MSVVSVIGQILKAAALFVSRFGVLAAIKYAMDLVFAQAAWESPAAPAVRMAASRVLTFNLGSLVV